MEDIIFRPHVKVVRKHDELVPLAVSEGPYYPGQIRTAYGVSSLGTSGAGTVIAIIDAYSYPNAQGDLNTFSKQFGLPIVNIVRHRVLGPQGQPPVNDDGWSMEQALDLQWAHAVAPGAEIMLVQAYSASTYDLFAAINWAVAAGANIISMSWGGSESKYQLPLDKHFDIPNIIFVASSGDVGSIVEYPSSSPYVIAVGGTNLRLNADNTRYSETGWTGSGGGRSICEPAAEYQINSKLGTSGNMRQVPDVAAVADPATGVVVYFTASGSQTGSWYTVGGTSLSAPLWAGFLANANEFRATKNKPKLSTVQLLTALYNLPKAEDQSASTTDLYDVTSGSSGKFVSGSGYDLVTGIGSPNLSILIPTYLSTI
ncbi:MAG: peptidase S8 and S53 subtilisin kexin sedolisin [Hyperionvirus sp.]|uniref:Peptidase S8 and S53 subtilisin kexin sedolisin n=1 Tax=Hyperionvirus sp. TaxID=2487770 RepID=A0A3G5A829_9VIRU|nr:MAG: peptidase S8 and S53 subtilisin kexin sedolisin [Hyperionvirus sp.]